MKIDDDRVVSFHYRLRDAEGNVIEDSHGSEPPRYLHGHGGVLPGLEREMAGRAAGERFEATLPPELAYGEREAGAVQRIPMKAVITRGKLARGQVIAVNTDQGARQVTVVKPGRHMVDVDINHPLAGCTLSIDVEIVDVREATAEERAHGHAHGPGGHAHS